MAFSCEGVEDFFWCFCLLLLMLLMLLLLFWEHPGFDRGLNWGGRWDKQVFVLLRSRVLFGMIFRHTSGSLLAVVGKSKKWLL